MSGVVAMVRFLVLSRFFRHLKQLTQLSLLRTSGLKCFFRESSKFSSPVDGIVRLMSSMSSVVVDIDLQVLHLTWLFIYLLLNSGKYFRTVLRRSRDTPVFDFESETAFTIAETVSVSFSPKFDSFRRKFLISGIFAIIWRMLFM